MFMNLVKLLASSPKPIIFVELICIISLLLLLLLLINSNFNWTGKFRQNALRWTITKDKFELATSLVATLVARSKFYSSANLLIYTNWIIDIEAAFNQLRANKSGQPQDDLPSVLDRPLSEALILPPGRLDFQASGLLYHCSNSTVTALLFRVCIEELTIISQ